MLSVYPSRFWRLPGEMRSRGEWTAHMDKIYKSLETIARASKSPSDDAKVHSALLEARAFIAQANGSLELKNLDVRFSRNIDKIVKNLVEFEVENLMQTKNAYSLMDLDKTSLTDLHRLYVLVEEYEEVELIENILSFNKT